jgi:Flp pilus assembly protein TadD
VGWPTKEDADAPFERFAQEVQVSPLDWRPWFCLAIAFEDAGDRKRARASMRQADKLSASGG